MLIITLIFFQEVYLKVLSVSSLVNFAILSIDIVSSGTRRLSKCPIFGSPKDIGERCLQTYEEVMEYHIYLRLQIKQRKNPSFKAIAAVVAQRLEILWKKAFIPQLSRTRMASMLQRYRRKINNLLKSKSKNSDNYKRKVQLLRDSAHMNFFDISACKCLDFKRCICKLKNRVPLLSVTSCVTKDRIVAW